MQILGVVPARYASTRFPGKPLADIAGVPMIERVWRQARKAAGLSHVVVATDDRRIFDAVRAFGGEAWMTSPDHPSGTDRLMEVAGHHPGYDAFVNVQGDEPFLRPDQIDAVCGLLTAAGPAAEAIGTLVRPITDAAELFDANAVKVVRGTQGQALYFSRSPIPHLRGEPDTTLWPQRQPFFRHLGIYGYTRAALAVIAGLPMGQLEQAESLEQLRWLEAGLSILTAETDDQTPAVDTPADLERILTLLKAGQLADPLG